VLGAARADDDDRRADPLAARLLDHAPAVHPRKHQVEHADVGLIETKPREPGLAVRDPDLSNASRPMKNSEAIKRRDVVNRPNTRATCLTVAELKRIWEPGPNANNT